jgi:hypothetical protein
MGIGGMGMLGAGGGALLPAAAFDDPKERARKEFADEMEKLKLEEERRKLHQRLEKEWTELEEQKVRVAKSAERREREDHERRLRRNMVIWKHYSQL